MPSRKRSAFLMDTKLPENTILTMKKETKNGSLLIEKKWKRIILPTTPLLPTSPTSPSPTPSHSSPPLLYPYHNWFPHPSLTLVTPGCCRLESERAVLGEGWVV